MVMYAKIRRMFFREHLSISEIGQRTSLSRNTCWRRFKTDHLCRLNFDQAF